jgi:uncharacterized protein (TIGR02147 family)
VPERTELQVFDYLDYRAFLRDYYVEQKAKRQLSYRRFSQEGGLRSPNYLKLVIDGQRNLSDATTRRLAQAVGLTGDARQYFLELVRFNQARSSGARDEAYEKLTGFHRYQAAHKLEQAHAAYHSTWYLPAIRELAASRAFRADPAWIAAHLKPAITKREAKQALAVLLELGLLQLDDRGRVKLGQALVSTGPETRGLHIARYHREMIGRAARAIDDHPASERDISSLTLCVGADGLRRIKERIQRFRRELVDLAVLDDAPRQVIQVNFQLFPLSEVCED